MNRKKILYIILISFTILSGCNMSYGDNAQSAHPDSDVLQTSSNIQNGGGHYLFNGVLYGQVIPSEENQKDFYLSTLDLGTQNKSIIIKEPGVSNVIINGDYIYYKNRSGIGETYETTLFKDAGYGKIFRVKLDGSSLQQLTDDPVSCFYIQNNFIYYQKGTYVEDNDEYSYTVDILKMSLEGTSCKKIYTYGPSETQVAGLFSISHDSIFLVTNNLEIKQVSLKSGDITTLDGAKAKLSGSKIIGFIPTEDAVYFTVKDKGKDFCSLYSLSVSEGALSLLTENVLGGINADTQSLYYLTDKYSLVKYNFESQAVEVICQTAACDSIEVYDSLILLREEYSDTITYKCLNQKTGELIRII